MTLEQAKKLKVGSRVRWIGDGHLGTVVMANWAGVEIQWDGTMLASYSFAHSKAFPDMEPIGIRLPKIPEKN